MFTLAQIESEEKTLSFTIQAFENTDENYLVKLVANQALNAKQMTRRIFQIYPQMKQRFLARRTEILGLLDISLPVSLQPAPSEAAKLAAPSAPEPVPERRSQLYQEVVRQIQHILVTQTPEQIVESVQRLLDYLKREGIATDEIQRKVIGQAIVQRARRDRGFREHLLQWKATAPKTVWNSTVGQAIQLAITALKS